MEFRAPCLKLCSLAGWPPKWRYHHSKDTGAPLALILHPQSLHGGTMNNRIAFTMYQSFQKLGFLP